MYVEEYLSKFRQGPPTKENKWQLLAVFRNGLSDVAILKH
jgi:hypothetical protein